MLNCHATYRHSYACLMKLGAAVSFQLVGSQPKYKFSSQRHSEWMRLFQFSALAALAIPGSFPERSLIIKLGLRVRKPNERISDFYSE